MLCMDTGEGGRIRIKARNNNLYDRYAYVDNNPKIADGDAF